MNAEGRNLLHDRGMTRARIRLSLQAANGALDRNTLNRNAVVDNLTDLTPAIPEAQPRTTSKPRWRVNLAGGDGIHFQPEASLVQMAGKRARRKDIMQPAPSVGAASAIA